MILTGTRNLTYGKQCQVYKKGNSNSEAWGSSSYTWTSVHLVARYAYKGENVRATLRQSDLRSYYKKIYTFQQSLNAIPWVITNKKAFMRIRIKVWTERLYMGGFRLGNPLMGQAVREL